MACVLTQLNSQRNLAIISVTGATSKVKHRDSSAQYFLQSVISQIFIVLLNGSVSVF